jgi:hypothetical protein
MITLANAQSSFLNEDELRSIQKGNEWIIVADTVSFSLTYDIWKNRYTVYNKTHTKSYSASDSIFIDLKRTFKLTEVAIYRRKNKEEESDVLLVDLVSKFIDRFKKRTIRL